MAYELISDLSDSELDAVAAGKWHGGGGGRSLVPSININVDISKSFNYQNSSVIVLGSKTGWISTGSNSIS